MTVAAGTMAKAEGYLANSLAACAAWQSECGAADAAEALAYIYDDGLANRANGAVHTRGELENSRPYALVCMPENDPFAAKTDAVSGDHADFQGSGTLLVRIVRNSPTEIGDSPTHDDNQTFKNLISLIIDQLCDLTSGNLYLAFHAIALVEYRPWPDKADIETWGLYQSATLVVQW